MQYLNKARYSFQCNKIYNKDIFFNFQKGHIEFRGFDLSAQRALYTFPLSFYVSILLNITYNI